MISYIRLSPPYIRPILKINDSKRRLFQIQNTVRIITTYIQGCGCGILKKYMPFHQTYQQYTKTKSLKLCGMHKFINTV